MEKAFHCAKCGADLILDGTSPKVCLFCHATFSENEELQKPEGGFFAGDLLEEKRKACTCTQCGMSMYLAPEQQRFSRRKIQNCLYCGSGNIQEAMLENMILRASEPIPFLIGREEAEEAYLATVKKEKRKFHGCDTREYLDAIEPVYVPFFFYDYHIFARTILSVVPFVTAPRHIGEKVASFLLFNEFTLEKTASNITPYPKTISSEMAWRDVPVPASKVISMESLDQIAPIKIQNIGTLTSREAAEKPSAQEATQTALLLGCDMSASDIRDTFLMRIKEFVRQCVITENLDSFAISSYVDETNYEEPIGQLMYIPLWVMKKRKKDSCFLWYMNALTGESSEFSQRVGNAAAEEVKKEAPKTLKDMSKKRIRNFTIEDVGGENPRINYRTYMIDMMASSISTEMKLNEMATDKSLLELERSIRRGKLSIDVPIAPAYQSEAERAVRESKNAPLPSSAVPLPTRHSPLYMMKARAIEMNLGRGQKLPETPIDRRIGNEDEVHRDNTPSAIAVEAGLADMPEFDPNGPNPFKNS